MKRQAWIWVGVFVIACDGESLSTTDGGMDGGAGTDARVTSDSSTGSDAGADGSSGTADGALEDAARDASTSDGGPVIPVLCTSNDECAATELCAAESCGGEGTCQPRPVLSECPDVVDRVCGCDGVTYDSTCEAEAAGANVARRGECPAGECELRPRAGCCFADGDCGVRSQRCTGEMCAEGGEGTCVLDLLALGRCWEDSDCSPGTTCEDAVICGCGVACVVDDSPGYCRSTTPVPCTDNSMCDRAQYCATAAGTCGDEGECLDRPRGCPRVLAPVCGCDGMTYDNECLAAQAGVNVASRGECGGVCELDPGDSAGCCFSDGDCPTRDQRCALERCVDGGEGVCVTTRLEDGRCWEDSDCRRGSTCMGAMICPCGVDCIGPDVPGRCSRVGL